MLHWCAYCQKFLGEIRPYDHLDVTHGICTKCAENGISFTPAESEAIRRLVDLQRRFWTAGREGDASRIEELLLEASRLGVRPVDAVAGLLAPLLVEVGNRWESGELSIVDEHRFTSFAEEFLSVVRLRSSHPETSRHDAQPSILLACVEGNNHSFGLKVLQLWLETENINCEVIAPGVPAPDLVQHTLERTPWILGLSVSLAEQLPAAREALALLSEQLPGERRPAILVGGHAIKSGILGKEDLPGSQLIRDLPHLHSVIRAMTQPC